MLGLNGARQKRIWYTIGGCRCIGATNKALAKRRAAEDALRLIAEKEEADAAKVAAAEAAAEAATAAAPTPTAIQAADQDPTATAGKAPAAAVCGNEAAEAMQNDASMAEAMHLSISMATDDLMHTDTAQPSQPSNGRQADQMHITFAIVPPQHTANSAPARPSATKVHAAAVPGPVTSSASTLATDPGQNGSATMLLQTTDPIPVLTAKPSLALPSVSAAVAPSAETMLYPASLGLATSASELPAAREVMHSSPPAAAQLPDFVTAAAVALNGMQQVGTSKMPVTAGTLASNPSQGAHEYKDRAVAMDVAQETVQPPTAEAAEVDATQAQQASAVTVEHEAPGWSMADDMAIDDYAY